jgi:DNA-3-methyladenine glycosylase
VTVDFLRPAPVVARDLLGATVVSTVDGHTVAVRLTEVEAYGAEDDPGSHAFRGRTPRNGSMYETGGTVYVYSIYGLHELLNLVTGPEGQASAVLVRSGVVVGGTDVAVARRRVAAAGSAPTAALARGPGNLAVCLGVTRALDGLLTGPGAALEVLPADERLPAHLVSVGPRVGLRDDGRAERYWVTGDPSVSAFRPAKVRASAAGAPAQPGHA